MLPAALVTVSFLSSSPFPPPLPPPLPPPPLPSSLPQAPNWDQVNLEVASSRKFKWLRERMGGSSPHTTLLNQIKNFVLTDEVDIRMLHNTLKRQVNILVN